MTQQSYYCIWSALPPPKVFILIIISRTVWYFLWFYCNRLKSICLSISAFWISPPLFTAPWGLELCRQTLTLTVYLCSTPSIFTASTISSTWNHLWLCCVWWYGWMWMLHQLRLVRMCFPSLSHMWPQWYEHTNVCIGPLIQEAMARTIPEYRTSKGTFITSLMSS
jgi:hypothetical protein